MRLVCTVHLYTTSSPYVIHGEEAICQRSMTKYGGAGSKITGQYSALTYRGEDLSAVVFALSEVDNAASEGYLPGYW